MTCSAMRLAATTRAAPLLFAALLAWAPPAYAQGGDADGVAPQAALWAEVTWELVGGPVRLFGFLLADTVAYVNGTDGLFRLPLDADGDPAAEAWALVADRRPNRDVFVSRTGALFAVGFGSTERSADGGATWALALDGGSEGLAYTPLGALITNRDEAGPTTARSADDGLTWTLIDENDDLGFRFFPLVFASLPASDSLPGGVVVAGGNGGLAYSRDDGFTWQPTPLTQPFRYRVVSVVRAPWGGPAEDPARGQVLAFVNDFSLFDDAGNGEVWASTDGAQWEFVGQVPGVSDTGGFLAAADDEGVVFALDDGEREDLRVHGSTDGGATWQALPALPAEAALGNRAQLEELAVDGQGRLWVALKGYGALTYGGVFRSSEPVVTVNAEGGPARPESIRLGTPFPNPSDGAVTVPLVVPAPAEVRLAVVDLAADAHHAPERDGPSGSPHPASPYQWARRRELPRAGDGDGGGRPTHRADAPLRCRSIRGQQQIRRGRQSLSARPPSRGVHAGSAR